jgi:cell division protein FtsL
MKANKNSKYVVAANTGSVQEITKTVSVKGGGSAPVRVNGTKVAAIILVVMVMAVLMMMMVSNMVIMNECNAEIDAINEEIEDLKEEERKYTVELEKKNDLLSVEEYAQSALGMVGEETVDSAYIESESEEGVEIYHDTEETDGIFATVMNALGQNIVSAWNSLQKSE